MKVLQFLGYALALGLLIGLERGWSMRGDAAGTRIAGLRTFGILGLAGGVAGLLPMPVAVAALLLAGAVLVAGYVRQSARPAGMSATASLVGLLTFLLGMACTRGYPEQAIAAAAVTAFLLSQRDVLHGWLRGLEPAEIRAAMRFAIITVVILPFLPDRAMGPLDAWNPHSLWLVVVLVSGLSFAGYVATRRVGASHGLLLAAALGSIVSSTAVTAAFARRLRTGDGAPATIALAISIASGVMFVRVLLLTAIIAPVAVWPLALIIGPALAVCLLTGLGGWRRGHAAPAPAAMPIGNPLEIGVALALAAFVAVVSVVSRWALDAFGHAGLATILLITGFADVDAAILALSNLPAGILDGRVAGAILAGPVLANTLLKAGITIAVAPSRTGLRAAAPLLASFAAGGLCVLLLLL